MEQKFSKFSQVQDLTALTLHGIFQKVGEMQWLSVGGDTAQTLPGSCAFRFAGLKDLMYITTQQMAIPPIRWLTRNFRATMQAVAVSNWVLEMMRTFFPNSFDSVSKNESGGRDGALPLLITDFDPSQIESMKLGSNQAVLVASEEATSRWKTSSLVLDASMCKGLQFHAVILVDVFRDVGVRWRQLHQCLKSDDRSAIFQFARKHPNLLLALNTMYVLFTRAESLVCVAESVGNPVVESWADAGLVRQASSSELLSLLSGDSQSDWQTRGLEFLEMGRFPQARICYERAADEAMTRSIDKVGTQEFFRSSLTPLGRKYLLMPTFVELFNSDRIDDKAFALARTIQSEFQAERAQLIDLICALDVTVQLAKRIAWRHESCLPALLQTFHDLGRDNEPKVEVIIQAAPTIIARNWHKKQCEGISDDSTVCIQKVRWAKCEEHLGNFGVAAKLYEDTKKYEEACKLYERARDFKGLLLCWYKRILRRQPTDLNASPLIHEAARSVSNAVPPGMEEEVYELSAFCTSTAKGNALADAQFSKIGRNAGPDQARKLRLWAAKFLLKHHSDKSETCVSQAEWLYNSSVLPTEQLRLLKVDRYPTVDLWRRSRLLYEQSPIVCEFDTIVEASLHAAFDSPKEPKHTHTIQELGDEKGGADEDDFISRLRGNKPRKEPPQGFVLAGAHSLGSALDSRALQHHPCLRVSNFKTVHQLRSLFELFEQRGLSDQFDNLKQAMVEPEVLKRCKMSVPDQKPKGKRSKDELNFLALAGAEWLCDRDRYRGKDSGSGAQYTLPSHPRLLAANDFDVLGGLRRLRALSHKTGTNVLDKFTDGMLDHACGTQSRASACLAYAESFKGKVK